MRSTLLSTLFGMIVLGGCGAASTDLEASPTQAASGAYCAEAQPKDVLIAELVKHSWLVNYPLTALRVDEHDQITGDALPELLQGDLDLIATLPEARQSLARAVRNTSGLPPYGMRSIGPDQPACDAVPAWTPNGTTTVSTSLNVVEPDSENLASWLEVHEAYGNESPLVRVDGNPNLIDPPGDGSTNLPASKTISASGVRADAFGLCPTGTPAGTYCKLSYATGVNWTGRSCQMWYGRLRCLLW
jgi:hypothetical protein